jgi:hypothetical protein
MAAEDESKRLQTWADVEALVTTKATEGLYLEFKRKTNPDLPALEDADRKTVSKTLSGFGNVSGGVLVMGVEARSTSKDEPDTVRAIAPIKSVALFKDRLESVLRTIVDPPIAGIELRVIDRDDGSGEGVVIVEVPESFGGPHRVASGIDREASDRYFMRTGSSTVVMPHGLLADRFARTRRPELRLVGNYDAYFLAMRMRNVGMVAATDPFLRLTKFPPWLLWRQIGSHHNKFSVDFTNSVPPVNQYPSQPGTVLYPHSELAVYVAHPGNGAGGQKTVEIEGVIHALNLGEGYAFRLTVHMGQGDAESVPM